MKIIICDDEKLIRTSLVRYFEKQNILVQSAENGAELVLLLQNFQPDCIFLDLFMPEMSGFEVLDQNIINCPVIVMTAFSGDDDDVDILKKYPRVKSILKKPFENFDILSDTLKEITSVV